MNGDRGATDGWLWRHRPRRPGPAGAIGWSGRTGRFWCFVRPTGQVLRESGWKLHVSSTVLAAPVVLARTADVLVRERCTFKFTRDLERLGHLVSNQCERGSGGKFLTVYPHDDEQFRRLADELDRVTDGLPGPAVLSDRPVRPGGIVHYRYGAFRGSSTLSNDGAFQPVITSPDGQKVPDKRQPWFSPPPWAVSPLPSPERVSPSAAVVLIGGRFVVREAIRHSYKGGIYRGTDQLFQTDVVLKQARPHALSGLTGADARDLLRHEAEMLDVLAPLGLAPSKIALVTHQEHLFLAEEWIKGTTLRKWVNERALSDWGGRGAPLAEVVDLAAQLVDLVALVHADGIVLRDMTPNNIMVTPDRRLRLIDLEHAARLGTRASRVFTLGYAGREQVTARQFGEVPAQQSDLFSLGATLFWLASGVHPLLLADERADRSYHVRLTELVDRLGADMPAVRRLSPLILGLTRDDPAQRWSLDSARAFLTGELPDATPVPALNIDLDRLIGDGLSHVLATRTPRAQRLWRAGYPESTSDPLAVQNGAAGVLAVLTRAARVLDDDDLWRGLESVSEWILQRLFSIDRLLPGLYFGRSGTAWALHDAAGLLKDEALAARAVQLAKRVHRTGPMWTSVTV